MPNIDITDDVTDVIPDGGTADVTDDSTPDQPIDSDVDDDADREPDDYDQTDAEDMGDGGDPIPPDSTPPAEELPEPVPAARTLTQAEFISDYSAANLAQYEQSGAVPYAVYDDGTERQVAWADVSDPTPAPVTIESEAAEVAAATNQHFWTDTSGAHVTNDEQDAWNDEYAKAGHGQLDNPTDLRPWHNILMNSLGILLRRGLRNLVSITKSAIAFFDGDGNGQENVVAQFGRNGAQIGRESSDHVTIDSGGLKAYKADGTPALVNSVDIAADHARIGSIEADTADIGSIRANAAKVANLTAAELEADHAKVGKLDTDYAQINLANVNNAYIKNGAFDKAAVMDETVFDLTGDKATIKEINADNITVRNLHTKNLVVDSAEGYVTIGDKKTPTKEYLDSLKDELQQEIDGAVETFTTDHVPLLNNYPASQWADDKTRAKHVGDICYVQQQGSDYDGFCYRFSYDSTTREFSWVLIKDSSVTKALGDISDLKTFQSETASWINETDEGLTTIRENHTQLSGVVDGVKATADAALPASTFETFESTTFKTVKDTVDEQSTKFDQLATTLGTNADGTTKEGDIVHRTSAIEQDVSGFKQTVSETYATKSTVAGIDSRVSTAESTITQHSTDIEAKVSKDGVIAAINLSTEESGGSAVKISADKVNITGAAVFSAINDDTSTTKINGGKVDADTLHVKAANIDGSLTIGKVDGLQGALDGKASNADMELASNLLLDTDVPSLTKVNAAYDRYWSDTSQSSYVTTSLVAISDPPEDGIRCAAQFVGNGTNTAVAQRALAFYNVENANPIPLVEGQVYTASWWARVTSGAGATRFMSPVGNNNNEQSGLTFLTTEWQRVTWAFIPKPNADYTRVWFYGRFAAKETGTIQLCGFKLQMGDHSGTSGNPNLTPWFSKTVDDTDYWQSLHVRNGSVSNNEGLHAIYDGEDGWAHITLDSRTSAGNDGSKNCYMNMHVRHGKILPSIKPDTSYTWLIEVRNMNFQGTGKLYVRPSVGNATLDIFAALNSQIALFDSDGVAHANVRSKASFSALTQDTRGYCYIPTGCYADFELRVSLYEGSYVGGYKPYSPTVGTVDDAAKTASNYIAADATGIKIANASPSTATTYQHQTATETEFVTQGVSTASFGGSKARIGAEADAHVSIDKDSVDIVNGNGETVAYAAEDKFYADKFEATTAIYLGDYSLRMDSAGTLVIGRRS